MGQPVINFAQTGAITTRLFGPTSRYYNLDTAGLQEADGTTVLYLRRRFVPQPDRFALVAMHTVTDGERLDNVTAKYLGDPQQFWRICDANAAMRPEALVETPGSQIKITLPEGVPGIPNA